MKLTFPHMGNAYITIKALLDELGLDYVIPPFNNKRSMSLGSKYAPEQVCLPLKKNLGNYIEAFEMGADTVVLTGGCGPCRFGFYAELEKEILHDNGFPMEVYAFEKPEQGIREVIERIKAVTGGFNVPKLVKAVKAAADISVMVDELERLTYKTRPREASPRETDKIYRDFRYGIFGATGGKEIKEHIKEAEERLRQVPLKEGRPPLRVGIIGEIYGTNDSQTTMDIDIRLGQMGIEVYRYVTLSSWVVDHMLKKALRMTYDMGAIEAARPYLSGTVGGHAQENAGNAIRFAKDGYDGVIQLYPLNCMPEIVVQSLLPAIERDYGMPILTLIIDEMTGEAGYITRLEAFAELMYQRRELQK